MELRRYRFERPQRWQPKAGWLVREGEGRFQNLEIKNVSTDDIFSNENPDISYYLDEQLLKDIGLLFSENEEAQQFHRFQCRNSFGCRIRYHFTNPNLGFFNTVAIKSSMEAFKSNATDPLADFTRILYVYLG